MRHLLATVVLLMAASAVARGAESGHDLSVAPGGSDENPGTEAKPFATIGQAQEAVRQRIAAGLDGNLTVLLRGGTYRLKKPLAFGPEDSGTDEHAVTYAAYPGETVTISGGRPITGWKKTEGDIWTARVPGVRDGSSYPRHLWVNGRRAIRARTPNKDAENPCWQLKGADLADDLSRYTLTLPAGLLGQWSNPQDMEVMVAGNWAINRLPIQSIDAAAGLVVLAPPHAQGHNAIRPRPGRWCYFENAPEMLDQPGEWYLDRKTGRVSYRPHAGEDMTAADVVAPVVERLVEVKGTPDRPVRNLHFRGIRFEHTHLDLPEGGYLGIQACHCTVGKNWSRPWGRVPAAIRWDYVEESSLEDCTVAHVSGCGIELVAGCCDDTVEGNHLFDVSGNGIMLGGPRSEAEVPKRVRIANNHVHACGVEYFGAVGIWVGFAQAAHLAHNLVHGLPYSGISVGWQWNPEPTPCKENLIEANHVYDVMNRLCDGGCIYTLGFQPGTVFRANHLHDAHRSRYAQGAPNNGMFIDQGSKGYLFERNVIYDTAAELIRFNQCRRDWHTWRDNHMGEASEVKAAGAAVIAAAGLEPPYRRRPRPALDPQMGWPAVCYGFSAGDAGTGINPSGGRIMASDALGTDTSQLSGSLLATILSDEVFCPSPPRSLEETGLNVSLIESLVCNHLALVGTSSGREIAKRICLPFGVLEGLFQALRTRQLIVHTGSAPVNDYYYSLTEQGRDYAQAALSACAYVGPAPVTLTDYVLSVEAQTIRAEAPKRDQLEKAFADISIDANLFEALGPAVNSGAGLFLYGAPGNGKSTLAQRITICFGQQIWVPHAVVEDGQLTKLFDAAYHREVESEGGGIIQATEHDQRWVRIRRPTVVVGGELTMDNLEIRHDPNSNVSEAPLQMKSNCGCLLIDDFGRQRIEPAELLNRWIVPLENRVDYLTLSTGKKIQVPFEQLIIFSTNLEPSDLVDEAFLRRIPYKIEIGDPSEEEFHQLFEIYCRSFECEYSAEVVDYLIATHYRTNGRAMRRCHPRDLLGQIRNYCAYNDLPLEMRPDYFDRVVRSYFTVILGKDSTPPS